MALFLLGKDLGKLIQFCKKSSLFLNFAKSISCGSICINWTACSAERIETLPTSFQPLVVIRCSVTFMAETYNVL